MNHLLSLQKDSAGKPIGFRGIVRDVTERKKMEETVSQSEERYRTILDEMEDGYFEVDLAGNYTFVNDADCLLLGHSREELLGASFRDHMNKEDIEIVYNAFSRIYSTGKPERGISYRGIRPDGTMRICRNLRFPFTKPKRRDYRFSRDWTRCNRTQANGRDDTAVRGEISNHNRRDGGMVF